MAEVDTRRGQFEDLNEAITPAAAVNLLRGGGGVAGEDEVAGLDCRGHVLANLEILHRGSAGTPLFSV